ncbi:MAG TPA: acyloxyacyl hydrolase [Sphingomonas sp.]|nr:acyloxyacyl hydrolase [Sphingomonas sp.]
MFWLKTGVLGASLALASTAAAAQDIPDTPSRWTGSEIAVGILQHGSNFHPLGEKLIFDLPDLLPGQVYDGQEEDGTVDVQLVYRTAPLLFALKPRLTGKLQVNTAGRTSFASFGAEWRQHILKGRIYAQVGVGLTVHDGYRFTPDPFEPGLPIGEARRRYGIYRTRTSFGSQILFNPNASLGARLNPRWAVEVTWEHFSHHQWFSDQNPGIDNLGLRLVHTFGSRR